jgi:HSP20 family protein
MLMRRPRTNSLIERFFDEALATPTFHNATLAMDVVERENEYIVTSPIAGVNPENIEVKLDDDVLTITAEIHEENRQENERTLVRERRYGKFSRSLRFGLPVEGEKIEADYTNGLLTVHVPKAEASQPKRINVRHSK